MYSKEVSILLDTPLRPARSRQECDSLPPFLRRQGQPDTALPRQQIPEWASALKPPASGFPPHLCPRSRSAARTPGQLVTGLAVERIILHFNYRAFPALSVKLPLTMAPSDSALYEPSPSRQPLPLYPGGVMSHLPP